MKEKSCLEIIKHHSQLRNQQQNPLVWDKDGIMSVENRQTPEPIRSSEKMTKFVIYSEFVAMMPYLQSVRDYKVSFVPSLIPPQALDVHNIKYTSITGASGNSRIRNQIMDEFRRNEIPVLLLSNVGKVGINLSAANILIVMVWRADSISLFTSYDGVSQDPLFSNQELRQVIGRVWRYPQQRQVIVYRLVALNTADTVLQEIAENKDRLLDAFAATDTSIVAGKSTAKSPCPMSLLIF
jgi:hypothetical protein